MFCGVTNFMEDNKNIYLDRTRKSVTVWFKNTIEETTLMQKSHCFIIDNSI